MIIKLISGLAVSILFFHSEWTFLSEVSCRRVKEVEFKLISGKFYSPEELREEDYKLREITLEGIVDPEAIPKDEEFVIYEVKKNNELVGWLWKEKFLDEEELKKRYELFVEAHARMDNILADTENGLDEETLKKLDLLRNKMHLWAILFGNLLKKEPSDIILDITNKQMQLKGLNALYKGTDDEILVEYGNSISLVKNWEKVYFSGHRDYQITHSSVAGFILRAISEYYKTEYGVEIITYTEEEERIFYERYNYGFSGDQGYKKVSKVTAKITFPDDMFDLIKAQVDFLMATSRDTKLVVDEGRPNAERELIDRFVNELKLRNWEALFPKSLPKIIEAKAKTVGFKGYNLLRIDEIGIPIPEFVILINMITEEGLVASEEGRIKDKNLSLREIVGFLEGQTGKKFWQSTDNPLLLSVRSSPSISMPGLLNTILNIGIGDLNARELATKFGRKFAYEIYARFLRSFGIGVFGINKEEFGNIPDNLGAQSAKELAGSYEEIIRQHGFEIPQDPYKQLKMAIEAVKNSWDSIEARRYREENGIRDDLDMAVIIQEMKFGNFNKNAGSFVLFTRDPLTGEKGLYIEYAPQRQGEDLVSGSVNPVPIEESGLSQKIINKIKRLAGKIEKEFGYAQDIEGVIEKGKVWILQTRDAKLSPEAEIKALVDMVEEEIMTKEEALMRINLEELEDRLSHMQIDPTVSVNPIATGIGASSGAVGGVIAFDLEDVKKYKNQGLSVILVKREFYPATHLEELMFSDGLLTQIGGRLSHGAIQGRIHEKPTIVSANIEVDTESKTVIIGGKTYKQGDYITLDGTNGNVYEGKVDLIEPEEENPYLEILRQWYEEVYGEEI